MSFNIPIIFDDSPFFDWDDMRRPQHRRNCQSSGRRQPSVFGQWADPEFFYDYPARKQHYKPNYSERQREYERESPEESRFDDEGAQGDIYDTEEQRRAPRSNFGYDGWDIPVQHMDRSSHKQHKHKHKQIPQQKSKASKAHHDISYDNEGPKQAQRKVNEASNTKKISSDTQTEHSNEAMKAKTGTQSKVIPEKENMEQQPTDDSSSSSMAQTTENSSQTTESENKESTDHEIPITYSRPKNTHRRLSKRLSQCDPPSPADIKLARIKSIVQKIEGIEEKIAEFVDPAQNKNYLYISETLMKILLDLDTIDSEGFDIVRKARKEGVRTVQALVDKLEAKLEENKRNSNPE